MFDDLLAAWYRLYCNEHPSRSVAVLARGKPSVCLRRVRGSGIARPLFEPAVIDSRYTLFEFHHELIRSEGVLRALADAGSLALEEVEALLLISQALVATLRYDEKRTQVDRVLLTAVSVWRARVLGEKLDRVLMYRWIELLLSGSRPLEVVRRRTVVGRRDGRLLLTSRGPEGVSVCDLFSILAKKPRISSSIGRHLELGGRETRLNIEATSELLRSLCQSKAAQWEAIWAPADIIGMWRTDKQRFISTLKWALDGFALVPWGAVEDIPPAEKSMGALDVLPSARTELVPIEVKARLEHFVDVTVMGVVRSLGDLELLIAQFAHDSPRLTKLLYILVKHLFRNEKMLISLARAGPLLARCPDGAWKPSVLRFASAHTDRAS